MNILVIGTIDKRGGAALISWEIRERLKADGHIVNTFVRYKYSDESDVYTIHRKRWQDWLVKIFANDLMFANTNYIFKTKEYRQADIIHCHNLHSNFFNLKQLIRMSREKPVIWTLHDLWAITGYANDSSTRMNPNKKRFLFYLWDNTSYLLRLKEKIYNKSKLYIVTVSDWLKNEVSKSILKNQEITRIYNGINTDQFKPRERKSLRKELGLPLDRKIIALGIKGWVDSNKIIDEYKDRNDVFFIALGHSNIKTENKNYKFINYLEDKNTLSKYLSVADIFLYPTHGDTFGLIATEAMACGTPVVTYNIDALPEIVEHMKTGYVAKYRNIDDLKNGIEYILNLPSEMYSQFCIDSRDRVMKYFTVNRMYTEYLDLYRKLLMHQKNKG